MQNPFDRLTRASVHRPATTLLVALLVLGSGIFLMVEYITADVSRASFYPDDAETRLLDQVEAEYNEMDLDLLHALVPLADGGLESSANWERLAIIESRMMSHQPTADSQLGLFGGRPVVGPAGLGMLYSVAADPEATAVWVAELEASFVAIEAALDGGNESEISAALVASAAAVQALEPPDVTAEELMAWDFSEIGWASRMAAGEGSIEQLAEFEASLTVANLAIHDHENLSVANTQHWTNNISFEMHLTLDIFEEIQEIDFADNLLSMIPHSTSDGTPIELSLRLEQADMAIVTMGIATEGSHEDDVAEITIGLEEALKEAAPATEEEGGLVVFGFNRFAKASTETSGSESPMLTTLAALLLGIILWTRFRSLRETLFVLVPTALTIPVTFGIVSWLGVVFNPAMFSIPVLILAIGVDYGLHVVARYREQAVLEARAQGLDLGKKTLGSLGPESRRAAVLSGAVLTSGALVIAIATDVAGFMSFNVSSLRFLRDFGTTIAVGLFLVYLCSITVVPALLVLVPPKSKTIITRRPFTISAVADAGENDLSRWIGSLVGERRRTVWLVVAVITLPMLYGITQLEPGFNYRDQLIEDEAGVVASFITLNDRFSISPSPLWFVIDVEVGSSLFSVSGLAAHDQAFAMLEAEQLVRGDPSSLWSELERYTSRPDDSTFSSSGLQRAMDGESLYLQQLEDWLTTPEGSALAAPYLSDDHSQMVIRFQAATLEWDQAMSLADSLTVGSENFEQGFGYRVTGDDLIIAFITDSITSDSVTSTLIVAMIILGMLVAINTLRQQDPLRGLIMWAPLAMVVCWVYGLLGLLGYPLNVQVVTIGALTLGLGVDYSVHFSVRMQEESEADPAAGAVVWTSRTVATTGRAMAAAAMTTAGGFAILLTSSLYPLRLMGLSFAIAITMALASSMILLPTLLASRLERAAILGADDE